MKAKEKADKLYWKFLKKIDPHFGILIRKEVKQQAMQCAIISVEEIILTLSLSPLRVDHARQTKSFWLEVKQELEKMKG